MIKIDATVTAETNDAEVTVDVAADAAAIKDLETDLSATKDALNVVDAEADELSRQLNGSREALIYVLNYINPSWVEDNMLRAAPAGVQEAAAAALKATTNKSSHGGDGKASSLVGSATVTA